MLGPGITPVTAKETGCPLRELLMQRLIQSFLLPQRFHAFPVRCGTPVQVGYITRATMNQQKIQNPNAEENDGGVKYSVSEHRLENFLFRQPSGRGLYFYP
jgi:hypothetical protein